MRLFNMCFAVAISAFLISSNVSSAQDVQVPVDDDFVSGELTSNSESPTLYDYRWAVFGFEGHAVLCGAGYFREIRVRSFVRSILRDTVLYANDTPIMQDVTFFNTARSARGLDRADANCRVSDVPVPSGEVQFLLDFGGGRRFQL